MKKKKYTAPELDMIRLQLAGNILLSSIEHGQTSTAGGEMVDPIPGNDPPIIGGFD